MQRHVKRSPGQTKTMTKIQSKLSTNYLGLITVKLLRTVRLFVNHVNITCPCSCLKTLLLSFWRAGGVIGEMGFNAAFIIIAMIKLMYVCARAFMEVGVRAFARVYVCICL